MSQDERISGDQGSIKPEETLTDIVRTVAYQREDSGSAPMRAVANGAMIRWLKEMESSGVEQDREVLDFALQQQGFDSVNEFVDAFMDTGEPVMAAARMDLADLNPEDLEVSDGNPSFELQDPSDHNDQ